MQKFWQQVLCLDIKYIWNGGLRVLINQWQIPFLKKERKEKDFYRETNKWYELRKKLLQLFFIFICFACFIFHLENCFKNKGKYK